MAKLIVNGVERDITAPPDTPLLYVLRNELGLKATKFGCGVAQCGACSILLDGVEVRACVMPLGAATGKEVTTLEGLHARWKRQHPNAPIDGDEGLHPVQRAWIAEQTPLCGFCQSGMMIKATELLEQNPSPSLADIKTAFTTSGASPHLCRCGSYKAVIESVQRAASLMKEGA